MNNKRIYEIIEKASPGDIPSKIFDIFIIILILLNVFAVVLGTVDSISDKYSQFFYYFEIFSVIMFSIEYLLRICSCTVDDRYKKPIIGRLKYIRSPLAIIDLIAILPFYLPMLISFDLRFVRAVRLFRLFRLFKMGRYSRALQTLKTVIKKKKEELLISLFAVLILLIVASSFMYYIENTQQPERFSSIPSSMWWGVATLTTVGYGDIYPITPMGKILGAIIALLGIGLFALPAGILASGFAEHIKGNCKDKIKCPYCGKEIDNK